MPSRRRCGFKEKLGGKVTAISMGPPQAEAALREAISMGVDEGILVSDRAFAGSDTLGHQLHAGHGDPEDRRLRPHPLRQAGLRRRHGPGRARASPRTWTCPRSPTCARSRRSTRTASWPNACWRTGYEVIESPLPCLLTVVKEINEPRLPSLKGKMAARKAEIPTWTAEDIGAEPGEDRAGRLARPRS